jgi:DNA-binding transcriptional LysR family regulator
MQLAHKVFSGPPLVRVTSFAALGEAAAALGIAAVGPERVMSEIPKLKKVESVEPVYREIWSVIHENRRHDKRLAAVREWAKLIV